MTRKNWNWEARGRPYIHCVRHAAMDRRVCVEAIFRHEEEGFVSEGLGTVLEATASKQTTGRFRKR